ncbi:radical SAM protein, partial [Streptomyces sp. P17]|uniref:radical SAM protein n=1 Tax=Streptomyces sp. P17 TaxID=3074716 RepID=UPI0037DC600A
MEYCQTSLLVLQPTPFCNIDCTYCYLPHRSSKKRLTFELAEIIFKKLLAFPTIGESVTIVWHAGEPMVLSVSYYER